MTTRERFLGKRLSVFERSVLFAIMHGHTTVVDVAETKGINQNAAYHALWRIYAKTGADNMADLLLMIAGNKASAADLELVNDGA